MNIDELEPLKYYLESKDNKKEKLIPFLEEKIINKIMNCTYCENNFLINDKLYFIKKNTLELEYIGNVYYIHENKYLGIKLSKYRNVILDINKYYIFKYLKKKTKREFMESLLEIL